MSTDTATAFAGLIGIHRHLIRDVDGDRCGPALHPPTRRTPRDWRPCFRRIAYEAADPAALDLGGRESFHDIEAEKLDAAIGHVLDIEGPVHFRVLAERLLTAADIGRLGKRIRARMREHIDALAARGDIVQNGDFVGRAGQFQASPVRDRSTLSDKFRDLDYVAQSECMQALFHAVLDNEGTDSDEALRAALDLLGFARLTDSARDQLRPPLEALIARNMLREADGRLWLGKEALLR